MPFSPGDKLGPYEILAKIGAGGMGEVYRARDPRLGRDVAIKVSAERFSERFDREARAVAALNHPNICAIYDVGPNYIVMEFVEGEAPKGPLPLEDALRIARQMGDALEEAHSKGIVHRDLKPANIKVKPDGVVKVLDFGLAKVTQEARSTGEDSPTLSMAATQAGMILGTAAYMSPEQARGKVVDKRADIWAFGVVFHELLTGRRLFAGEDISDTLAAVIKDEPEWEGVPLKVQRLLKKCLQKDPKNRLRDVGDAWELLESGAEAPRALKPAPLWIAIGVLVVGLAIALWAPWRAEKAVEQPLVRLEVELGADVDMPQPASTIALSPDGTRLVYSSGTPPRLFIRRLDQTKAAELTGTENAQDPFFSPDGEWVGFTRGGVLARISVAGGAVVPLSDAQGTFGGSWGQDGDIVAAQASFAAPMPGLVRIPSSGGAATPLIDASDAGTLYVSPQVLPGGKAVLFAFRLLSDDPETGSIEVATLSDRKTKTVIRGATAAKYLPSGHLIYSSRGTLFAVLFDLDKLEARGTPAPILNDLSYLRSTGQPDFDFSPAGHGTLVYRSGGAIGPALRGGSQTIQLLDTTGKKQSLLVTPGNYQSPRLSPDGKRFTVIVDSRSSRGFFGGDVAVYDIARENLTRLTGGALYGSPVWTPDGKYLVLSTEAGMVRVPADGSSQPQPLMASKRSPTPWSITPDGKTLAYTEGGPGDLWTVPLTEEGGQLKAGKAERLLGGSFSYAEAAFSPDGKWLAYVTQPSSTPGKVASLPEVYVRPFPAPASGDAGQVHISNNSGVSPVWSRGGAELLYTSLVEGKIMSVNYTIRGGVFDPGKPRIWAANEARREFDLAPDGKRVVMAMPVETPQPVQSEAPKPEHTVVFLQNFLDELRRRVPLPK